MFIVFSIILTYLIGSIPTAYIYGKKFHHLDIREHGSGNVGATNVFRVLGKKAGIIVLLIDIFKGLIPVVLFPKIFYFPEIWQIVLLAVAAVCGHNWTCFLNFKGGKGIATSLGVLIGLTIMIPAILPVLLAGFAVWLISFLLTGFVSLSSILAGLVLPVMAFATDQDPAILVLTVVFAIFIVYRHRSNISRLRNGEESRINLFKTKKNQS